MDLKYTTMPKVMLVCELHMLNLIEQQPFTKSIHLKYILMVLPTMKFNKISHLSLTQDSVSGTWRPYGPPWRYSSLSLQVISKKTVLQTG